MDIRTREAVRYLGYGTHAIDERTLQMIQDSFEELEQIADTRFIYRIFEISFQSENRLEIGNSIITSKNLYKNLNGCKEAVLFGATLGTRVDARLKKYSLINIAKAAVYQACAAAYLEEYCDACQEKISEEIGDELYLRPRFSPGYGDFPISYQKDLLQLISAQKHIGLSMTDSYMLTPTKSVTAIIGISREKQSCHKKGCEACAKLDCAYRRS